jgi:hypothetical protein
VVSGRLDRRRLALVAARFQSPHDGERLAALEAFGRLLRAGGTTWQDFIGDEPAAQDAGADVGGNDANGAVIPHVAEARELLRRGAGLLTTWEGKFLVGLQAYPALSTKQRQMLDGIRRKLVAADATWSDPA